MWAKNTLKILLLEGLMPYVFPRWDVYKRVGVDSDTIFGMASLCYSKKTSKDSFHGQGSAPSVGVVFCILTLCCSFLMEEAQAAASSEKAPEFNWVFSHNHLLNHINQGPLIVGQNSSSGNKQVGWLLSPELRHRHFLLLLKLSLGFEVAFIEPTICFSCCLAYHTKSLCCGSHQLTLLY